MNKHNIRTHMCDVFFSLVELLASLGVQWHDLSKDSLKELVKSLEEQEEASKEKSAEEDDADPAALG